MELSTDSLRTFVAVCECKSFSLATSRVHKSQGAISTQIAKLEEQAGVKFLNRSQRPFKLTDGGKLFLAFARETLARTEEIQRSFHELNSGVREEVRIGATRAVGMYLLPDIIKNITREFPKLKLSLFTQSRISTYERLKQGELDLAVTLSDTVPEGLIAKSLRSEPLCFVVSPRHPLAAKKIISPQELKAIPFALGVKGNEFSDMVDNILEKHGIPRATVGLTINSLLARKEAARAGVGIAILPNFTAQDEFRNKTLTRLRIKGIELPNMSIMLVETKRPPPNRSVELVKRVLERKLSAKSFDEKSKRIIGSGLIA